MKSLLLSLAFAFSSTVMACSCAYDYGYHDSEIMTRAAKLVSIDAKAIKLNDYSVKETAKAYLDPYWYSECGCTKYVKRVWDISYMKSDKACDAKIEAPVWKEALKVKNIVCR